MVSNRGSINHGGKCGMYTNSSNICLPMYGVCTGYEWPLSLYVKSEIIFTFKSKARAPEAARTNGLNKA